MSSNSRQAAFSAGGGDRTMGITAKEIAEKLGVSPSAVSLALNGKPGVSVATRERILAEAIRLDVSGLRQLHGVKRK